MYYEINVSLNGKHLFATAERSIKDKYDLEKVYNVFKEKFSEEDGYEITITYWETIGRNIEIDED